MRNLNYLVVYFACVICVYFILFVILFSILFDFALFDFAHSLGSINYADSKNKEAKYKDAISPSKTWVRK